MRITPKNRFLGAAAAGLVMFCTPLSANSQSLKEARAQETEERALEREASFTRSVCGMNFDVVIDWRSAANWPDGASIAESCDGALGALEAACRRGGAPRVSRFVCAGDGSGASLRGGTLRYGASPGDNGFSETRAVLND
ncbi:hypothetical protein PUV54_05070 [Hyphococcus flavus]|uniref:Uncharacterized protein n=1 Tax=Hyphococcus flavus TaxID=1866326 RepID=A0AAE9ZKZ9_9PROT|nr:hypothetical protein [Hyphococcus flavus]WDI32565.1 hypothetical protein PUV54_05070 [Hyphococcus flavus]